MDILNQVRKRTQYNQFMDMLQETYEIPTYSRLLILNKISGIDQVDEHKAIIDVLDYLKLEEEDDHPQNATILVENENILQTEVKSNPLLRSELLHHMLVQQTFYEDDLLFIDIVIEICDPDSSIATIYENVKIYFITDDEIPIYFKEWMEVHSFQENNSEFTMEDQISTWNGHFVNHETFPIIIYDRIHPLLMDIRSELLFELSLNRHELCTDNQYMMLSLLNIEVPIKTMIMDLQEENILLQQQGDWSSFVWILYLIIGILVPLLAFLFYKYWKLSTFLL
jgi:hypothetical protein